MTKYLIMKCEELHDQYECDANREPMFLVDDWEKWYQDNHPDYKFEVYEFVDDEECTMKKGYEESMDYGMALYYWNEDEDYETVSPTVVAKYERADRKTPVPDEVWKVFRQGAYWADGYEFTEEEFKNSLKCSGYASWDDKEYKKYWVYGNYADGRYCLGY